MSVRISGPLFDGAAELAVHAFTGAVEKEVGSKGVNMVKSQLGSVLKNPTGNYESHITVQDGPDGTVVTDGGIIYGPWLEGVGSRNQTTRFKGYNTFRLVGQRLNGSAVEIATRVLPMYLSRMN